jgi:transposase-like protein
MQRIPRRQFTDDFKSQAVVLAESVGTAKAARQLDISAKTLANWLTTSRSGKPPSSSARQPISELEAELARLRAENATLKMEREISKKSDGVLRQGVQVRYAFVALERT